jgi:hypothetical protein
MALKPCRECGKEISDQAEVCPHCGIKAPCFVTPQPVPQTPHEKAKPKKPNGCLIILGGFLAILISFAVIAAIGSSSSLPSSSSSATPNAPATQSSALTTSEPETPPDQSSSQTSDTPAVAQFSPPSIAPNLDASTWDGPSCFDRYNQDVCSIDPHSDNDTSPCYESANADNGPNLLEVDIIKVCQAAKAATNAQPAARADALQVVVGRVTEMTADINQDTDQANDCADTIKTIGIDMEKLGGSEIAYSGDQTDDGWSNVSDDLDSLIDDSSIMGHCP